MFSAVSRRLSPLLRQTVGFQRSFISSAAVLAKKSNPYQLLSFANRDNAPREDYPSDVQRDGTWGNLLGDIVVKPHDPELFDVDKIWQLKSRAATEQLSRQPPANAYAGRSVKVINGNVAEAYRKLEIILNKNKVKYELKRAERHEKKGVKRRRLSSERWRKQFANEVRNKVQLVTQIRNRGA